MIVLVNVIRPEPGAGVQGFEVIRSSFGMT